MNTQYSKQYTVARLQKWKEGVDTSKNNYYDVEHTRHMLNDFDYGAWKVFLRRNECDVYLYEGNVFETIEDGQFRGQFNLFEPTIEETEDEFIIKSKLVYTRSANREEADELRKQLDEGKKRLSLCLFPEEDRVNGLKIYYIFYVGIVDIDQPKSCDGVELV